MGINGTTDSNCIIEFIRKVCLSRMKNHDRLDKKFMFVCDNAKVHVSNDVKKFCLQSNLRVLTISPYS